MTVTSVLAGLAGRARKGVHAGARALFSMHFLAHFFLVSPAGLQE